MKQEECYAKPKRVVQVGPEYPDAHNNLGLALSSTGKGEEAIAHLQQAVKLSGGPPLILSFLGELYANVGRVPEAVEVTGQALAIATQANDSQLLRELQARIAAYQSRR